MLSLTIGNLVFLFYRYVFNDTLSESINYALLSCIIINTIECITNCFYFTKVLTIKYMALKLFPSITRKETKYELSLLTIKILTFYLLSFICLACLIIIFNNYLNELFYTFLLSFIILSLQLNILKSKIISSLTK